MKKELGSLVVGIAKRAPKEWIQEFRAGCESLHLAWKMVDTSCNNWIEQLQEIDILLWRIHLNDPTGLWEAQAKIPVVEKMGILCFPGTAMARFYDDKIAQTFFFRENGIPTPETFISFEQTDALDYVSQARYPLVAKTAGGASSAGVSLVQSRSQAERIIYRVFREPSIVDRLVALARRRLRIRPTFVSAWRRSIRARVVSYVYFQEFVESDGDLRVVALGPDLVSVFARRNRPGDFRASGSGRWDSFVEGTLPIEPCEMALEISNKHGFTSMAFDFLQSKKGWLVTEMSYTFLLNKVYTDNLYRRNGSDFKPEQAVLLGTILLQSILGRFETKSG